VAGAKGEFTVRNAGTDAEPRWRLVEFRDLAEKFVTVRLSAGTEGSTWGQVKALYR